MQEFSRINLHFIAFYISSLCISKYTYSMQILNRYFLKNRKGHAPSDTLEHIHR